MKIAYQDLLNFLLEKPSINLLSEKLFQLGHEHEIEGDHFNMELTPNRGDCLSINGLARDLNVFFGQSASLDIYDNEIEELDFDFENLSPENCPRISFLELEIEKIPQKYLSYLESYFRISGSSKTNFFSDISNYVSYELGQPTHCFDRDKIREKLIFDRKICNESFTTLFDTSIQLKGDNCIFLMGEEIISLAGIMGGKSTSCSKQTKRVLLECAYFDKESIIGKSIKYNLTSDAAYKFERGVDILSHEKVLRRFIKIVKDHAKIKNLKIKTFEYKEPKSISLPINISKINNILGTEIIENEYLGYLKKLGFHVDDHIKVPAHRHDVICQNDLAEEIARVIGYNNIESKPFKFRKIDRNKEDKILSIKNALIENGFYEVINFPFSHTKIENKSIAIDNPLDSNRRNLRISLKESLLDNLLYNERRQRDSIKIFELSDVYHIDSNINQEKKLGIIVSGRAGENFIDYSKKLDSNYLESLLIDKYDKKRFIIEEIPRDRLKTKRKDKIFYIEILINDISMESIKNKELKKTNIEFVKYEPISEFPSSKRDFSFSITNISEYENVLQIIENFKNPNLKNSFIFDFYKNSKLDEIKLGVSLVFQSPTKTLSENEIQESISDLLKPIIKLDGVSVPGLELN